MPVGKFVKENLNGYKGEVVIFPNSYTNDPQYMTNSFDDLKKLNPELNLKRTIK